MSIEEIELKTRHLRKNIRDLRKILEEFNKFRELAYELISQDINSVEFIMREFVKFVIPKKRKFEFIDFAQELIHNSNLPLYLLSDIFQKDRKISENFTEFRINMKISEYSIILGKIGWIEYIYFMVRLTPRRIRNVWNKSFGVPQTSNYLAMQCAEILFDFDDNTSSTFKIVFKSKNAVLYMDEGVNYRKILDIEYSQIYTLMYILLVLDDDNNRFFYIIRGIFEHLVDNILTFNYIDFFKFLVKFDLFKMIDRYSSTVYDRLYFEQISKNGKIPDEDFMSILQNASQRVKYLYFGYDQTIMQSIVPNYQGRREATKMTISVSHLLYENTIIPSCICDIIADYFQLGGSRDQGRREATKMIISRISPFFYENTNFPYCICDIIADYFQLGGSRDQESYDYLQYYFF